MSCSTPQCAMVVCSYGRMSLIAPRYVPPWSAHHNGMCPIEPYDVPRGHNSICPVAHHNAPWWYAYMDAISLIAPSDVPPWSTPHNGMCPIAHCNVCQWSANHKRSSPVAHRVVPSFDAHHNDRCSLGYPC